MEDHFGWPFAIFQFSTITELLINDTGGDTVQMYRDNEPEWTDLSLCLLDEWILAGHINFLCHSFFMAPSED